MALSIFEMFDGDSPRRRKASNKEPASKPRGEKEKVKAPKKQFSFYGGFTSQADAKKKAKEVGGFIREKNGRFYVMKEK